MSQIDINEPGVNLAEYDSAPFSSVPREALDLLKDEWQGHVKDIREHQRAALADKTSRLGRIYQRAKNSGYAALYTGYFWFDDFPARGLTKVTEGRAADMALVGGSSLVVGGIIAFARRRQLKNMYKKLGHEVSEEGPSISQMANASIMGAPNTVKATAQKGRAHERHLMNTEAILASAAVYAALQSVTAGPVIDGIDRILPGGQFSGEVAATALFVAAAMYTKSLVEVSYHRFRH